MAVVLEWNPKYPRNIIRALPKSTLDFAVDKAGFRCLQAASQRVWYARGATLLIPALGRFGFESNLNVVSRFAWALLNGLRRSSQLTVFTFALNVVNSFERPKS